MLNIFSAISREYKVEELKEDFTRHKTGDGSVSEYD